MTSPRDYVAAETLKGGLTDPASEVVFLVTIGGCRRGGDRLGRYVRPVR